MGKRGGIYSLTPEKGGSSLSERDQEMMQVGGQHGASMRHFSIFEKIKRRYYRDGTLKEEYRERQGVMAEAEGVGYGTIDSQGNMMVKSVEEATIEWLDQEAAIWGGE